MPRTKQIVGLDLGARTVRAVWVELVAGAPVVTRLETFALPADAPDAQGMIHAWLDKIGLAHAFCALALPGASTIFQPGRLPHGDPRTPEQAAAMDLVQFNEMAGDTMRYDLHAFDVPSEPGHLFYLLAMARPVAIDHLLESAVALSIRPADLVPAPAALHNALEPLAGPHTQPWMYLDIGHQQTDVAIGLPNGMLFARSIPIGGRAFTEAIAQAASLNPIQAEARKHNDAILDGHTDLTAPLSSAVGRWLSQLNSCLSVYRSQFGGPGFAISQVVLTGGGAKLRGLPAHLSLPVIQAAELPGLAATPKAREWVGVADLAMGLAISIFETGPVRLSLLPAILRDEIVFKAKKPYWVAAAALGALALGVFTASGLLSLSRDRGKIMAEREELKKCEALVKQIEAIHDQEKRIGLRAAPVLQLLMGGPIARDTLTLVANSIHSNDWITLFCDEASYIPPAAELPPPKTPPARGLFALFKDRIAAPSPQPPPPPVSAHPPLGEGQARFIIEGYTPDPSLGTVKEMLGRLRTAAHVVKADLLADDRVLPPPGMTDTDPAFRPSFRRFVIQLEVTP